MRKLPILRPRRPAIRLALTLLGIVVIILSPIVGAIPGPGGLFVFAAGLALLLQNAPWAKRGYARLKRRWPRAGGFADLGLRRASALRRRSRDRQNRLADDAPTPHRRSLIAVVRDFVRGR